MRSTRAHVPGEREGTAERDTIGLWTPRLLKRRGGDEGGVVAVVRGHDETNEQMRVAGTAVVK
jgi:hypothetical protein